MLTFGRLVSTPSGVFSVTVVGDGSSNSITLDFVKGPSALDLKGVVPVGVVQTTSGGTKTGKMSFDPKNPTQLTISIDAPALGDGQIADLSGFLTFAGVTPPPTTAASPATK